MSTLRFFCVWLVMLATARAAGPPVLEPVIQGENAVTAEQNGKSYPIFRPATDQKLVAAISQVFESSFAGEMQRLFELSREIASARNHRTGRSNDAEFSQPIYLLLSQEEGGFARRDFFLEVDGKRTFVTADYIDLIVDEQSVADGDFEEIFSHELGHSILRNLVGDLVGPRSNKLHQSMTLTDYRTAFDEGFAEHFQPVARQNSSNSALSRQQRGVVAAPLSHDFLSQRDQLLRNFAPSMDAFIHERIVPGCSSQRECYVLEETSTSFDPAQLRSGQQLLSSEGMVATVFLQLLSEDSAPICATDCSSLEAKYRKLFEALADVTPTPKQSPLIQTLNSYRAKFPEEGKRAIADFLLLTRGATVSAQAVQQAEALAQASSHADISDFRARLHSLRDLLNQVTTDVLANKLQLDAAVGPELWIRNDAFTHSNLWDLSEEAPLRINLNTASAEELATLPEFGRENGLKIVRQRKQSGYFGSIDDLAAGQKLSSAQIDVLKNAARSQANAKPDPVH